MYQAIKSACLLISVLIITVSCEEYNPTGENNVFVESDRIDAPPKIVLNNIGDTITMLMNTEIQFNTLLNENNVLGIEIDAEPYLTETFTKTSASLEFDSKYVQQGFYPLYIRVYFDSKTNSLANRLDAEIYYTEYQWIMHYVPMHIDWGRKRSKFITATQENGMVKLNWQKYTLDDFSFYSLYTINDREERIWSKTINNHTINTCYVEKQNISPNGYYYLRIYRKNKPYIEDWCIYSSNQ